MEPVVGVPESDVLSELLGTLRVKSTVWCRSVMSAPWGFGVPSRTEASFHFVVQGEGWVEIEGVEGALHLGTGDLVILPTGRGHAVRDDPASGVTMLETILATVPVESGHLLYGGGGPRTELVCGGFEVEDGEAHPVLASLPPVLHVHGDGGRPVEWLRSTVDLLRAEMASTAPGADAFVSRLTDVVLTQALRVSLSDLEASGMVSVGALRDREIAEVLRLIHDDPGHPWSVAELASKASLSRSAFAARFRAATGESPMRFVTSARLSRAAHMLRSTNASVSRVAHAVGYESEASLARTFKRQFGTAPGRYGREGRS